jgi:hypothetical protein
VVLPVVIGSSYVVPEAQKAGKVYLAFHINSGKLAMILPVQALKVFETFKIQKEIHTVPYIGKL